MINKLFNRPARIEPDPIFEKGLDVMLGMLNRLNIKATFFVVARDIEARSKKNIIRSIARSGHEIASHGLNHDYLADLPKNLRKTEIGLSKAILENFLGEKVKGFKSPGFSAHPEIAEALIDAGYLYDSSVLASFIAPFMELVSNVRYKKRSMMCAPASPYMTERGNIFKKGKGPIVEIPVTTIPALRLPAHFSYLLVGGNAYKKLTLTFLDMAKPPFINYLFHPLDFVDSSVGCVDERMHGIAVKKEIKRRMAEEILGFLGKRYNFITSSEMCALVKRRHGFQAS